jgi:outer membrane protein assembly factor BamB
VRFSKRWRARINASVNATSPLVVGDKVFVTASYNTGALLAKVKANGIEEVWSNDTSLSSHFSNCVAHDGLLFGFDGRQEEGGRLRCLDLQSGAVQWTKDGLGCGTLLLAEGKLFVLGEEGELVLLEAAKTYREKGRAAVLPAGPCRAHLALSNGRLYGRDQKTLVCWDVKKAK